MQKVRIPAPVRAGSAALHQAELVLGPEPVFAHHHVDRAAPAKVAQQSGLVGKLVIVRGEERRESRLVERNLAGRTATDGTDDDGRAHDSLRGARTTSGGGPSLPAAAGAHRVRAAASADGLACAAGLRPRLKRPQPPPKESAPCA
uniref:Uncharacterized protein n=1 Tax=Cereibacter sphaeroides (strain ATCC 17025 / ATH 2.4.3) TaxID=349102 RepID=A4WSD2_CERS5